MMRRRMIVLFLAPALLLYLSLLIVPALQAFVLSFYDTSGFGDSATFIGTGNYSRMLTDSIFWRSVRNTAAIMLIGGIAVFALAFLLTVLINSGLWGRKLFRAMIFMPNVIAVVAITTFWSFVFMPRYGLLSNALKSIGLDGLAKVAWTAPENVFWSMLAGMVWLSSGFFMILIMAGADKIPGDMYEAAKLEGASQFQMFRFITVPMIWDVMVIAFVLWTIQAIKAMEFPYAFGGPNIDQNLYTTSIYLYIMGFGQREPVYALGYATAIGVVMLAMTVAAVLILRLMLRRDRVEY